MNGRPVGGFQRACALVLSMFIVLSQFVMPVAALAQDVTLLPAVTLYYMDGENQVPVSASVSMYDSTTPVYWVTVPAIALQNGISVTLAGADPARTYLSTNGDVLYAADASAVDGNPATYIQVISDGAVLISCPLYLSTIPMPAPEVDVPTTFEPAYIRVNYYDENNAVVGGYDSTVPMEGKTFDPAASVPEGYELTDWNPVTVTMDGNGMLSHSEVAFYVRAVPKTFEPAYIRVNYYDENYAVVGGYDSTVPMEGKTFDPAASVPEGYELTDWNPVTVTMDGNGMLSHSEVAFYVRAVPKTFEPAYIRVNYYDENNAVVGGYDSTVPMEGKTFDPAASVPEGYELTDWNPVTVTMDGNGMLSHSEVAFYVRAVPKTFEPAYIRVNYYDENYAVVGGYDSTVPMEGKTFDPAASVPEGYELTDWNPVTVTMDGNGMLSHSEVAFYVRAVPKTFEPAYIRVNYYDENYAVVGGYDSTVPMEGKTFDPAASVPEGYELTDWNPVTVTMDGQGFLSHSEVAFYVKAIQQQPDVPDVPTTFEPAYIRVNYYDENNAVVGGYDSTVPMEGKTFDPAASVPEGYELTDWNPVTVTMDGQGFLSHSEVAFYVKAIQQQPDVPDVPTTFEPAYIRVNYYDENNAVVGGYDSTVPMEGKTFDPAASVPEGYELTDWNPVTVTMDGQGFLSHSEVAFYVKAIQQQPDVPDVPTTFEPAYIRVNYYDENNAVVGGYDSTVPMEGKTFDPAASVPEGYELTDWNPVTVTMDGQGFLSHSEVAFYVRAVPKTFEPAYIRVNYYDENNAVVGGYDSTVPMEGKTFDPAASVPEGYELTDWNPVTVTMDGQGFLSHSEVAFYVKAIQQQPEQPAEPSAPSGVTVLQTINAPGSMLKGKVNYRSYPDSSDNSNKLGRIEKAGTAVTVLTLVQNPKGEHWYNIEYNGTNCYVAAEYVQVEQTAPVTADVTIRYVDENGADIPGYGSTQTLSEGPNATNLYYQEIPGYTYQGVNAETVTVSASGADVTEVVFSYKRNPVTADVTIRYVDETGADIPGYGSTQTLNEGPNATNLYYQDIPGYTYQGVNAETVTVSASGADVTEVVFSYKRNPVTADVTIRYVDENGVDIPGYGSTQTLNEGPNATNLYYQDIPGYTYQGVNAETVTVSSSGADVTEIVFSYKRNPVTADVTIRYVDENGVDIPGYGSTQTLSEGPNATNLYYQDIPGYTYQGVNAETVTVSASGADVTEVVFSYKRNPVTADVTVRYVDETGADISGYASHTVALDEGAHDAASLKADIPGYTFQYANPATITVGASGADYTQVWLAYTRNPVTADVVIRYVDENGNDVPGLTSRTETLGEGVYDTSRFAADAPAGYTYGGVSAAQVVVDANGASVSEVVFTYNSVPAEAYLNVSYLDADRNPILNAQTIAIPQADYGKTFPASTYQLPAPQGYEFVSASSETVSVDARGVVSPQALEFLYAVKPAAKATVTFEYLSADGRKVADPLTITLDEGVYDVMEFAAAPEKFTFSSVSSQTVTITPDGQAQPALITFTYAPVRDTAILQVHYRTSIGEELPGSPEKRELKPGTHTITPNAAYAPGSEYALSGNTQSYQVTVGSDLVAMPNSVTFTYYDASITGTVKVQYYDSTTNQLITTEDRVLSPGVYDLTPNEALVSAKGKYEMTDAITNTRVEVKEDGSVLPTIVNFYYKPADIEVYQGYLLVTTQTALRANPDAASNATMVLPVDTVLWTAGQYQSGAINWNSSQTVWGQSTSGWVNDAHVRRISADEAQARIEEYNQQANPSQPDQNPGYYITLMDGVPLRQYANAAAQAKYLRVNTVVYVYGQEYGDDGYVWHETTYGGVDGYVREGQLRKLTQSEVDQYLASGGTEGPGSSSGGGSQYDPNGASSYGYVSSSSVNFRATPSTDGKRIKTIQKYGMALIIGTKQIDGVTWYNINYSGTIGWVHGDYFHQMTLTEFQSFMGSSAYYEGITNNAAPAVTAAPSTGGSTGSATQGNVSSVEDWNVGAWQNTGVSPQTSYQPFNPYATPAATPNTQVKGTYTTTSDSVLWYASASVNATTTQLPKDAQLEITGQVTIAGNTWYAARYEGRNGYIKADADIAQTTAATATPTPTATFVIGTMIPIDYEDESRETQTNSVPWGLIGGAVALVGAAGGGLYLYALNQNKRRKAAAARAAASRRTAAAGGTSAAGSPYARRAVAAPPQQRRPQQQSAQNPYGRPYPQGRQTDEDFFSPIGGTQQENYYTPSSRQNTGDDPFAARQSAGEDFFSASTMQTGASNPYANPYAQPRSSAPAANPFANGSTASSNPYARPISPAPAPAQEFGDPAEKPAPRRRATRMQRYHEADSGDNGSSADLF